MKRLSYLFILFLAFNSTTGCNSDKKLETCYQKSVAWLWDQQAEDGGWHSKTHTVLRDGKALTPYILYFLLEVPVEIYPLREKALKKGIEFIRKDMMASMAIVNDSVQEFNYPNYSAAYALRVLYKTNTDRELQRRIANYLLDQQFLESRAIHADQLAYGGWGYGEPDLKPGEFGHVDLSHTRRILEALIETHYLDSISSTLPSPLTLVNRLNQKRPPTDEIDRLTEKEKRIVALELFLAGTQRWTSDARLYEGCISRKKLPYDGGFVSSLATLPTNKCKPVPLDSAGLHYPSYATATCDGLLAMHALGMQKMRAYTEAVNWLTAHQQIEVIDGLSPNDPEQWYLVMHYYHWSVRAEAMMKAGIEGPWKDKMKSALIHEQQPEGFYINPLGGVNKEDDPLMATIFCVQAFTYIDWVKS